jgi:MoaA/NifB/PqqE/SkfB family radical SAM enzyme
MNANRPSAIAFEHSIFDTLRIGLRITLSDPRFAIRAIRLLWRQYRAARVRTQHETRGIHVPPFVIFSVTAECNLTCGGCYDKLLHPSPRPELSAEEIRDVLTQARDLGTSILLIAGGEPLLRAGLLDLLGEFPQMLFLLFTNGTLLDGPKAAALRRLKHVIPVLSIEGDEERTDGRRGSGTYRRVMAAMERLRKHHVFFGTSTTLTRENFDLHLSERHLRNLIRRGCRLFYSINYVPVEPGTEHLQLEPEQVHELERRLEHHRATLAAIFIAFPHDEVALGGCLAAGRGFLHINAYGDVEPCPFSPYSDSNLRDVSLERSLGSPLLQAILSSGVTLDETDGRCALWKRRNWVAGLVAEGPVTGTERSRHTSPDDGLLAAGESLVRGE